MSKFERLQKYRIELMGLLNVSVLDRTDGDNLYLSRDGICIPYNAGNFMTYNDDFLIDDVINRFKDRESETPSKRLEDRWKKLKEDFNNPHENNIELKKKNIRNKLIERGLMCSES